MAIKRWSYRFFRLHDNGRIKSAVKCVAIGCGFSVYIYPHGVISWGSTFKKFGKWLND